MKQIISYLILLSLSFSVYAQSETEVQEQESPKRVHFNLQLKNMHYWRGYAVTTAPMFGSNLYYQSANSLWRIGLWGGMGFNGAYREFDYYISFQKKGFSAALWDIYNFSTPDISGRGFFDYNNRTTGRFIDLTLAYDFGKKFPLKLSSSTILHGRDSQADATELDPFLRTGSLRYSTYLEGRYTLYKTTDEQLQAFLGGSLAMSGGDETFYTTRSGINFVGLQYNKLVEIGKYSLPVQATPAWNPNLKHAYMEVAISFF